LFWLWFRGIFAVYIHQPQRPMKFRSLLHLTFCAVLLFSTLFVTAQESNVKLNVAADIVSRYVWRGLDFGASPNIQPTLSLTAGNFEIGSWGAISTLGTYSEVDLYAKYTLGGVSLGVTDYFFPTDGIPAADGQKYFNWKNASTGHVVETFAQYKGGEKFPVSLLASVLVYGNDKDFSKMEIDAATSDTTFKNNYSAYVELGYSFNVKGQALDVFAGFTPAAGFYGSEAAVVNAGISTSKKIAITDKFELPVKASLITNPLTQNIYFVLGITL
jgi:hypothetical protein